MGRGLGLTQRKVLDYLERRWQDVDPVLGPMVPHAAVAAELATSHSEAQAIRRAIRTLRDRGVIGSVCMRNNHDVWLVPRGANGDLDEPRRKPEGKMPQFRAAIAELLTPKWQPVPLIRLAVLGERKDHAKPWQWDADRQLFNRALGQLCDGGVAVTSGSTTSHRQNGWMVRLRF